MRKRPQQARFVAALMRSISGAVQVSLVMTGSGGADWRWWMLWCVSIPCNRSCCIATQAVGNALLPASATAAPDEDTELDLPTETSCSTETFPLGRFDLRMDQDRSVRLRVSARSLQVN